jgi:hypothetical protein
VSTCVRVSSLVGLLDEASRVAAPGLAITTLGSMEHGEIGWNDEARARFRGAPREVEIIEMEAVVALGVEPGRFPNVASHGDEGAVERADALAYRRLESGHHQQDACATWRRRVQDVAVDEALAGVTPARPCDARGAGDAHPVVAREVPDQPRREILGHELDVVVAEHEQIALRAQSAAVEAFGERASVVHADDVECVTGEAGGDVRRDAAEARWVDRADDERDRRRARGSLRPRKGPLDETLLSARPGEERLQVGALCSLPLRRLVDQRARPIHDVGAAAGAERPLGFRQRGVEPCPVPRGLRR